MAGREWDEVVLLLRLSYPNVMIQLLWMLMWVYTSSYIGTRFGKDALAGYSLANISGNILGLSIVMGTLSAADTLGPQAFGSGKMAEVGLICLRSAVVAFVFILPLVPLWYSLDTVLVYLKQPPQAAAYAYRFLSVFAMAFPGIVFNETIQRFYRSQNVVLPFVLIRVVTLVLHPFFVHVFVNAFGFDGAPVAHVASVYVFSWQSIVLVRHFNYHDPQTLPVFARKALSWPAFKQILRLAIPGVFSMSEWWFWETVCFAVGELGVVPLASHSIAYAVIPLCFMIPCGFSFGISTRVGVLLAKREVGLARSVSRAALAACMVLVLILCISMYLVREWIFGHFTQDLAVLASVEGIWPLVVLYVFNDGLFGVQSGLLRALSMQRPMSLVILANLWIMGLPAMWLFAWHFELGLVGVWITMVAIYILLNVFFFLLWKGKDWEEYSIAIQATFSRLHKAKVSDAEDILVSEEM